MFRTMTAIALLLFALAAGAEAIQPADVITIAHFSSDVNAKRVPAGWELKEKSGKAVLSLENDEGIAALRLRSDNASFSFQRPVHVDLRSYPVLSWKWKVRNLPQGGDFRRAKTDDQAAQLFLAFGRTRAIVYIWDTSAPQDMMQDAAAPFFMTIKAIVVRSGERDTGRWITEMRNVADDYRRLFGEEPPPVSGVRLQINSQHTGTTAESSFADVLFMRK